MKTNKTKQRLTLEDILALGCVRVPQNIAQNYWVNSHGKVYRKGAICYHEVLPERIGTVIKPRYRIEFNNRGKRSRMARSRLVGLVFVPNPYDKDFCHHKDRDGSNDHYSNLMWMTDAEHKAEHAVEAKVWGHQGKALQIEAKNILNKITK